MDFGVNQAQILPTDSEPYRLLLDHGSPRDSLLTLRSTLDMKKVATLSAKLAEDVERQWQSVALLHTEATVCSLLCIKPGASIPLHDHPGASGAHLVLIGGTQHHQFDVIGRSDGAWVLKRTLNSQRMLTFNDLVSFAANAGNAHSFVADKAGCVLLHVSRLSSEQSYWYYPINEIASQTLVALRKKRG